MTVFIVAYYHSTPQAFTESFNETCGLEIKALPKFMHGTHYCALLQEQSVSVEAVPSGDPQTKILRVESKVIETFKGEELSTIRYMSVVDVGDSISALKKEPVIQCLCKNREGYSWPGVGSTYSASHALLRIARFYKRGVRNSVTKFENFCE